MTTSRNPKPLDSRGVDLSRGRSRPVPDSFRGRSRPVPDSFPDSFDLSRGRSRPVPDSFPRFFPIVQVRHLDGHGKQTTGTATVHSFNDYGVNADGPAGAPSAWNKRFSGPLLGSSPRWTKTTSDFLGRPWKTERPALDGTNAPTTVVTENHYDSDGRRWKTSDNTLRADTITEYDDLGNQTASGLDLDSDGALGTADRYTTSDTAYTNDGTDWYRVSWSTVNTGSVNLVTTSVYQVRLTGLSPPRSPKPSTRTSTATSPSPPPPSAPTPCKPPSPTALQHQRRRPRHPQRPPHRIHQCHRQHPPLPPRRAPPPDRHHRANRRTAPHRHLHRPLRRQTGTIERTVAPPRTGTSTVHYAASGEIDYTEDAAGYRTTYGYDESSRQIAITDPNTNTVERHYSPRGEMLSEWNATYPVHHEFDGYGQQIGLYTLRATNVTMSSYTDFLTNEAIMDKTTWLYNDATGLMTNKLYADGNGPTYTYTKDGKLHTRTWARGIVTTYGYATGTRQLLTTDYSDGTPGEEGDRSFPTRR